MKQLITLSLDVRKWLEAHAKANGVSMSRVVETALVKHLTKSRTPEVKQKRDDQVVKGQLSLL